MNKFKLIGLRLCDPDDNRHKLFNKECEIEYIVNGNKDRKCYLKFIEDEKYIKIDEPFTINVTNGIVVITTINSKYTLEVVA